MAESMKGLKRTHRCTELSAANVGEEVTVMGWVQKNRNKGGIIFVDLRDRSGILQIIFEQGADLSRAVDAENFAKAEDKVKDLSDKLRVATAEIAKYKEIAYRAEEELEAVKRSGNRYRNLVDTLKADGASKITIEF